MEEDGGKVPSLSSDNVNTRRLRSSSETTENRERVKREQDKCVPIDWLTL